MGARVMLPGLCSAREHHPFRFDVFFFERLAFWLFTFLNKVEEVVEGSRAKSHVRFCRWPFSEVKVISG